MSQPYLAIWPGQPGGYVPVLADQLLQEPGVQARAAAWRAGLTADPTAPPKPTTAMHMHGMSEAGDAAIRRYRAKGLELEAKHEAIKAGRKAAQAVAAKARRDAAKLAKASTTQV